MKLPAYEIRQKRATDTISATSKWCSKWYLCAEPKYSNNAWGAPRASSKECWPKRIPVQKVQIKVQKGWICKQCQRHHTKCLKLDPEFRTSRMQQIKEVKTINTQVSFKERWVDGAIETLWPTLRRDGWFAVTTMNSWNGAAVPGKETRKNNLSGTKNRRQLGREHCLPSLLKVNRRMLPHCHQEATIHSSQWQLLAAVALLKSDLSKAVLPQHVRSPVILWPLSISPAPSVHSYKRLTYNTELDELHAHSGGLAIYGWFQSGLVPTMQWSRRS